VRTRHVFFCILEDATVISKSNLILCGGQGLLDAEPYERQHTPLHHAVDAAIISESEDGSVWILNPPTALATSHLSCALSLLGVHSFNFGHWITEFLPKLWACIDGAGFEAVPVLVDRKMPQQHLEAMRCWLGPQHEIIVVEYGQRVDVERLWAVSMPTYYPVGPNSDAAIAYPDGIRNVDSSLYIDLFSRASSKMSTPATPATIPKRIYLRRKDTQHRRLINRAEIEGIFLQHGFVAYDFGDLTFQDQINLIRHAELVAGPDGSAFMATCFGQEGLRILCLAPPNARDFEMYNQVCERLGHDLCTIPGTFAGEAPEYSWMADYRVDVESVRQWLATVLAPAASRASI
jgi:capsular polysaccharide biosynthesis protein